MGDCLGFGPIYRAALKVGSVRPRFHISEGSARLWVNSTACRLGICKRLRPCGFCGGYDCRLSARADRVFKSQSRTAFGGFQYFHGRAPFVLLHSSPMGTRGWFAMQQLRLDLIATARPNFLKVAALSHESTVRSWRALPMLAAGASYARNMADDFFSDLEWGPLELNFGVRRGSHPAPTARVFDAGRRKEPGNDHSAGRRVAETLGRPGVASAQAALTQVPARTWPTGGCRARPDSQQRVYGQLDARRDVTA